MKLTEDALVHTIRAAHHGISLQDLCRKFAYCTTVLSRHLAAAVRAGAPIARTHYSGPGVLWCAAERRDALVAEIQADRMEREQARQRAYNERIRVKVRKERASMPMQQTTVPAAKARRVKTTAASSVFEWRP